MAKRKKPRTAAQKAATRKMIAANRAKRRGNPTRKPKRAKKATVKTTKTGRRQVVKKKGQSYTQTARKFVNTANKRINKSPKAKTITRRYKSGKYGVLFRENPAMRGKAIMAAAGGFAVGIVGADVLDRYIATRAPDNGNGSALTGQAAKDAINAKPDGMRIFAQAAGTGVAAVGAYALRKKSMVGTYLLGGLAAAFAAKALGMVVKGHLMPALLPAKDSESDFVKRLAYGDLKGPRGYMGAPRPFQGKPAPIGPRATGSVGAYGCTRVPVNASAYMTSEPGKGPNCTPWPFQMRTEAGECIDKVGRQPSGTQVPRPAPSPMPKAPPVRRREPAPRQPLPITEMTPRQPLPIVELTPQPRPFVPVMPSVPGLAERQPGRGGRLVRQPAGRGPRVSPVGPRPVVQTRAPVFRLAEEEETDPSPMVK
jgi:hypothetical protein